MIKIILLASLLTISSTASAALLEFEFNGTSDPGFGPQTTLSGSFLFDTSLATLEELETYPGDNLSRMKTTGGVSGFNLNLVGVVSGSPDVSASMGADLPSPVSNSMEGFMTFATAANSISFSNITGTAGISTLTGWNNSADPIADFWLDASFGASFWCMPTHNSNYPSGNICGSAHFEVTPIPVPAAAWLFGSALVGLAGIKRKR